MVPTDPGHDLVGRTLAGRYEVLDRIARGGMGVIYRARQVPVDRVVALKVMSRLLSDNEYARKRFFREARVVSGLRHPNTVTLIDFGQTPDDLLYQVFEFYDAPALIELMRAPMDPGQTMRLGRQIAGSLLEAHEQGIVHRDIKPENVLVDTVDGVEFARVLDFGIARSKKLDEALTASGVLVGTPEYGSPEQAQSRPVDHRSDIYSLGVLLFAMLTAQLPYLGTSKVMLMMAHVRAPIPRVSERGVTVEGDLEDLVTRMMAKAADDRPQSMSMVRDTLDELLERTLVSYEPLPREPTVVPADTVTDDGPPAALVEGATRWLKRVVGERSATLVEGSEPDHDLDRQTQPITDGDEAPTHPRGDGDD